MQLLTPSGFPVRRHNQKKPARIYHVADIPERLLQKRDETGILPS